MRKLNLEGIYQIKEDISKRILNNFITNIVVINSSDIVLSFSFVREKLLISLNHQNPFLGFIDNITSHTVLGQYNDNLRHYLKGAYLINVEVLNDDRILKFTLHKSDEFYEKETYYLILELIPTISNLILLNEKEEIVFAKHYSDLTASRPIVRKLKYEPISKNKELERGEFDYDSYQKELNEYVFSSLSQKQKEKALPLYNFFKQKIKSLNRKIKVLEKEIIEAKGKLKYIDLGNTILTIKEDKDELQSFININKDIYDIALSPEENATNLFNKYKKSKRTIENDEREIDIARNEIEEYQHYLDIFDYLSEDEIIALTYKYLPKVKKDKKRINVSASDPYYIEVNNVKIAFGKNKEQNNNLTFKKAQKDYTFIHLKDYSASHVVIFSSDVNKDLLLVGLEIALLLSGRNDGDLQVAKIKDIKKGHKLGEVILNNYQTYTLKSIRSSSKELLKEQRRF